MKKIFFVSLIVTLASFFKAEAQPEYRFGLGLRAGWPTGVSAKLFMSDSWALEAVATGRHRGIGAVLLLEKHKPAFGERWYWLFGGGLHGAFYNAKYYNGPHKDLYTNDSYSWGIDAIGGLEYVFGQVPLSITADIKPAMEINHGPYVDLGAALTVRYTF